jgi:hypothetical protein
VVIERLEEYLARCRSWAGAVDGSTEAVLRVVWLSTSGRREGRGGAGVQAKAKAPFYARRMNGSSSRARGE